MECIHRLNQSMNYIEEHLTGEIDYEQLGRIASCSTYHYQSIGGINDDTQDISLCSSRLCAIISVLLTAINRSCASRRRVDNEIFESVYKCFQYTMAC